MVVVWPASCIALSLTNNSLVFKKFIGLDNHYDWDIIGWLFDNLLINEITWSEQNLIHFLINADKIQAVYVPHTPWISILFDCIVLILLLASYMENEKQIGSILCVIANYQYNTGLVDKIYV